MKMTKRFEKKLKAFAMRNNLDTNFNWDIGWFDFLYDNFKRCLDEQMVTLKRCVAILRKLNLNGISYEYNK